LVRRRGRAERHNTARALVNNAANTHPPTAARNGQATDIEIPTISAISSAMKRQSGDRCGDTHRHYSARRVTMQQELAPAAKEIGYRGHGPASAGDDRYLVLSGRSDPAS
jgi:hypothetical protein